MQRLHLLEKSEEISSTDETEVMLKPSSLPPLFVNIDELEYGSMKLGHVTLVADPSKRGVKIKKLVVADGNHKLVVDGAWNRDTGTRVNLKLTAKDAGKMLNNLSFNSPLKKGELSADGTLRWPDSPIDFRLEKLNGVLNFKATDGLIEDIDSNAGQLIGLFSVHKLINRIFLDFSDLKDKGMGYEELAGKFHISNGELSTDNLRQRSLEADVLMIGKIGLINRDYDLDMSIIPKISDAVPVAGTLIFGPQVAVTLLAFRKLFGKAVDKASMQQYRVTGSWEKPNIKKIEVEMVEEIDG